MNFEISKDEYKNGAPRRYKLELSLTGALGLGTVLFLGLVWVFIFGVLVGRGYQPEKAVPELARLMPEGQSEPAAGPEVIQPEELTFLNSLRDEPRKPAAKQPEVAPAEPERQESSVAARPETAPVASEDAGQTVAQASEASRTVYAPRKQPESQPESQPAASRPDPATAEAKPALKPAKAPQAVAVAGQQAPEATSGAPAAAEAQDEEEIDQTQYDYVYQIASLSEPAAALRFRDKVRKLGLHSEVKVVRGEKKYWHRVVVQFQGRPIDTREMKAKLKTLGVDKPLLRSKVPVS